MATETLTKPIEIFYGGQLSSGNGVALNVSNAELDRMVQVFNASGKLLPLVPGHPQDDNPALGQGSKLALRNGRIVLTEVQSIDPAFRSIVNSGELNRVSVKLRLPDHPENSTGTYEFRHVGFLGRSDPALDQLGDAEFTANPHEITVMSQAPTATPPDAEFAQREAEFAKREAEFAQREVEFKRAQKIEPELEQLVRDGKLLPGEKAPFVALFSKLPEDLEIEFSKDDGSEKLPVGNFLKQFLTALKPRITYGEITKTEAAPATTATFSAPKGFSVSNESQEAHSKAIAYCQANGLNSGNPTDLVKAYRATV